MLNADKLKIEKLISNDEAERIATCEELDALDLGHFEDHPISQKFIHEREKELIDTFYSTKSEKVKEWILQVLAEALIESEEVVAIVANSLTQNCKYLPTLLYYMWQNSSKFINNKQQIKTLSKHADAQVRWRVALVLENMPLEYGEDIKVIRELMLDEYYTTRTYAVLALKKLNKLGFLDRLALKRVIKVDDGAARTYALELLGK
ncbi:hypothetical protein L9G74_10040 [Shewanella sp. C32]|uniref:HEAT repeat domain-containing protein n=1 Tax=Shewanella electrica TaxID=515560 RepID=A0ABT2FKC7_9GAMM|nr:hypothetical protein [Shewanella electrica]MCH1924771.1 hypothetical protein [Shewanella electrica]MCS4556782.1 hypothetical protein [Shewanella electrica]